MCPPIPRTLAEAAQQALDIEKDHQQDVDTNAARATAPASKQEKTLPLYTAHSTHLKPTTGNQVREKYLQSLGIFKKRLKP